jgi:hypothetical protein
VNAARVKKEHKIARDVGKCAAADNYRAAKKRARRGTSEDLLCKAAVEHGVRKMADHMHDNNCFSEAAAYIAVADVYSNTEGDSSAVAGLELNKFKMPDDLAHCAFLWPKLPVVHPHKEPGNLKIQFDTFCANFCNVPSRHCDPATFTVVQGRSTPTRLPKLNASEFPPLLMQAWVAIGEGSAVLVRGEFRYAVRRAILCVLVMANEIRAKNMYESRVQLLEKIVVPR